MQFVFSMGSVACVLLSAVFFTAVFRLKATTDRVLSLYLFAFATLLAASIVGSLLSILDEPFQFLLVQGLFAALAVLVWWRGGSPPFHLRDDLQKMADVFRRTLRNWRDQPLLLLLVVAVFSAYLVGIFLILYVPPSEFDSATYRLPRAAYWLQHGDFSPWVTNDYRQTTFPIGGELLFMWAMMLVRGDMLVGLANWTAAVITSIAVYGLTTLAGFNRKQAVFAALMWAILPQVYLQSTSTQTDLIVGVLVMIAVYFLYQAFQTSSVTAAALGGLAVGLGIGTKLTIFFAAPGIALAALVFWLHRPWERFRPLLVFSLMTLAAVLLFGSYIYVQNMLVYGGPLGPANWVSTVNENEDLEGLQKLHTNLMRIGYQWLDFSALPPSLAMAATAAKANGFQDVFTGTPVIDSQPFNPASIRFVDYLDNREFHHEAVVWFGLLGFTLVPMGLVWSVYRGIHEKNLVLLTLPILFIGFFLTQNYLQTWTPFKGRYYVFVFAFAAPVFSLLLPPSGRRVIWRALAIGIALVQLGVLIAYNSQKPLVGERSVLAMTYLERKTLGGGHRATPDLLAAVEQVVPEHAGIAIHNGPRLMADYPFLGRSLTNWAIQFPGDAEGALDDLTEQHTRRFRLIQPQEPRYTTPIQVDYVVVSDNVHLPDRDLIGWEEVYRNREFSLLSRTDPTAPFTSSNAVPVRYVNEFDVLQPQMGWQGPQISIEGDTIQWSAEPTSTIKLALNPTLDYLLRFEINEFLQPQARDTLIVSVNEIQVPHLDAQTGDGAWVFDVLVPRHVMQQQPIWQTVDFTINDVTSPQALGVSDDPRMLGLAMDWVRMEPLQAEDQRQFVARAAAMYRNSLDPLPERYVNEFDAPQLEWGWHGVESGGPAETLQWSSQPTSLLEMSLDIDRDYRLQFEVVAFLQAEMQDTFTVSLNGITLATQVEETEADTLIYEAIVPSAVMRRATIIQKIEFSIDEITSPEVLGISPDPRPLGLAIDWVRLEPLSDADENGSNLEVSPLSGP